MAKRPDFTPAHPVSTQQLADMRRKFALVSTPSLQHAYAEAHERCKLGRDGRPPKAEFIQELVQAWKQMRKARSS